MDTYDNEGTRFTMTMAELLNHNESEWNKPIYVISENLGKFPIKFKTATDKGIILIPLEDEDPCNPKDIYAEITEEAFYKLPLMYEDGSGKLTRVGIKEKYSSEIRFCPACDVTEPKTFI